MDSHRSTAGNGAATRPNMPPSEEDLLVNGDGGYISDESSFYGDTDLQKHLESLVDSSASTTPLPPPYLSFTTMALTNAAVEEPSKPQALYNLYEGKIYARQLDQPVSTFLELLPPRTTQRSHIGEWIYIANPYGSKRPTAEEWARTRSTSAAILSGFVTRCAAIEASMDDMSKLSVIKKINRLRIKVKTAILDVADVHGCTDGKWMLFPMPEDVNQVWEIVARATAKGDLGTAAKVATDDGQGDRIARLICVYTEDFGDKKDVKRVLLKLKELGLIGRQTGISYKPDIFTYLEITGNNKWGLKPSLYQSKEALSWDV